jgi:AcrR family transcriptional regulator
MAQRVVTSPRKQPHQQRAQDTVEALLEATARVLCEHGYDRASTNRIAQQAGVSIGSLYQYFPSKEALVAALIDRQAEREFEVARAKMVEVAGAPLRVAVRELCEASLAAHSVNPKLHKVLFEQVPRLGRLRKLLDLQNRAEQLLCAYLEARREEIRPKNLELAVFILVQAVEATTHCAALERPDLLRDRRLLDELCELVVRYLAK